MIFNVNTPVSYRGNSELENTNGKKIPKSYSGGPGGGQARSLRGTLAAEKPLARHLQTLKYLTGYPFPLFRAAVGILRLAASGKVSHSDRIMDIDIIPRPARVSIETGCFQSGTVPVITGDRFFQREIENARRRFSAIGAPAEETSVMCKKEDLEGAESYRMRVSEKTIEIGAQTGPGMHNGLETARQLVLSGRENGKTVIPCAHIEDWPRFTWRGFMLDTARHYYEPRSIKKLLDALSLHHINIFHWHLTDDQGWRFNVPEYPKLAEIGSRRRDIKRQGDVWLEGCYSDETIREIVDYAASLHITVVPEVDLPGHASAILAAYPELGCAGGPYQVEDRFGIFPDVLCAGNDVLFDLADAVLDSVCRLFPSPWIHIGGDEVPVTRWEACPRCKARMQTLGLRNESEIQPWITARFAGMIEKRGKKMIGWDEILEGGVLPADTVVMSWRSRMAGVKAASQGHKVIMTPKTDGSYLDYRHSDDITEPGQHSITTIEQCYRTDPTAGMDAAAARGVLGGQGNLWSELIYADKLAEYMIFPRICALSEAFWTPVERKDFDRFKKSLGTHYRRLDSLDLLYHR